MLTCLATSTLRALIVRVCQPRPDTTHVGTGGVGWCWCQRTGCKSDSLFITLPTYMRQHGFVTAGNGKLFHPVSASAPRYGGRLRSPTLSIRTCNVCLFPFPRISCNRMHAVQMGLRTRKATTLERGRTERTMWKPTSLKNNGVRACAALLIPKKKNQVHRITTPEYVFIFKLPPPLLPPPLHHHRHRHLKHTHTRARAPPPHVGTIPGPHDPVFNRTMGLSFMESSLTDEEQTDGILAADTVQRLANFSRDGIGKAGANKPFFLSTGKF